MTYALWLVGTKSWGLPGARCLALCWPQSAAAQLKSKPLTHTHCY